MREITFNGVTYRLRSRRVDGGWEVTVLDAQDNVVLSTRGIQMGAAQLSAIKRLKEWLGEVHNDHASHT